MALRFLPVDVFRRGDSLSFLGAEVFRIRRFACAGGVGDRRLGHPGGIAGSFDEGLTALLGLGFALPGVFLCRNYWRASPGILTAAGGFFCWGAVFPVGMLLDHFAPHVNVPAELWNTPKLFVAFGMILAIVEDKSESIESMQRKERALNHQLERFSTITSQLLSGATVDLLCNEIASAITEVSNFRVAAIELDSGGHGLRVAGASGLSPRALAELEKKARRWTADDIKDFCARGRQIGQNSFLLSRQKPQNTIR